MAGQIVLAEQEMTAQASHLQSALNRRGAPVLGQQAGVDVEGAKTRDVQEGLRQNVAICSCDTQVRPQL